MTKPPDYSFVFFLVGKPVIKGTRLAVEFIVDLLAQGWSDDDISDFAFGFEHLEDFMAR